MKFTAAIWIIACALLILNGNTAQAADEPFQPTITLQELGQQCAASIGRFHVELQVSMLKEAKYQAEIERLRKLVTPKETETK